MSITNTIRGFGLGLILAATTLLAGCHTAPERGALIGAGVGGVLGAAVDEEEPARGAIIGAAIGAV
ncbi:MAG: glycine zipper 2TM domain-containing protein, partial [Phycisphaerae bacterium]|nr:glycine zipper 2TM domain-containing protein [Phycisphaerae bacterium]